jgi:hypothetical protein
VLKSVNEGDSINNLLLKDYHWWWRSFIASGGCAFYVFVYAIFYFITEVSPSPLLYHS